MGIPQVPDRIKEAPAVALRAVFAGVGQLLLAAEKIRARAMEQAAQLPRTTPAGRDGQGGGAGRGGAAGTAGAPPAGAGTAAKRGPELNGAVPAAAAAGSSAPSTPARATPAAPARPDSGQPPAEQPPIPNYGELSVASLRARLRVLDEKTVAVWLAYEKAHANRDPVITMFERRLAKLRGGDR